MPKNNVLVISVSNRGKGGVASVVTTFMNNNTLNSRFQMSYFHSHQPGTNWTKIKTTFLSYCFFPFLLLRRKINVAHIHGSLKSSFFRKSYFLLWLKLFSIPTIYQLHAAKVEDYFKRSSRMKKKLVRSIFSLYDLRLCLGSSWQSKLKGYTGVEWKVLYNPVQTFPFSKRGTSGCHFTFMGELTSRKGVVDLLQAFSLTTIPDAKLFIAGNGDQIHLETIANEFNVAERVIFLGWVDLHAKRQLLEQTDVVILPSYAEGLPMSILEAMSVGLPVITTPVGAVEDAITDGVEGVLVTPGNILEIASAMDRLAANKELRSQLGCNAKKKYKRYFNDDVVVDQLSYYYNQLICESL